MPTASVIFWSGSVADDGKGPVEPGAHFYRSYQLDGEGNPINKRNAWQARSVLYVRLIPPGAADVAHYPRASSAATPRGPISFTAKLNYRKFSWYLHAVRLRRPAQAGPGSVAAGASITTAWNTHFCTRPSPPMSPERFATAFPTCRSSRWPQATATVPLGEPAWTPVVRKQDRERWNDWGIGLLLQGDLKGAEYAFRKVTEAEPGYADGWLNVARALIQEGETDAAKPFIAKALAINPELGRIWFFKAAIQKADGDYDGALQSLEKTRAKYPRDRVVLNQIGRHSVPEAPVRGEPSQVLRAGERRRSGGRADALHADALLSRTGRRVRGRRARSSSSGASRRTNRRSRSPNGVAA